MASDDQPSKFLSPKFGDPPPPEPKVAWDDEDVLNFIAQVTAPKQLSDHTQELEKIQAVHQRRDELIHQLEISWELSHLDNVTQRFQTWFIENQHLADTLIHLRAEMFDALDQACDLFTDALDHARHRLQSKQAETAHERETRERTRRQRAEAADREHDLQLQKRRQENEKHQQETQDRLQAFIDKDRCRQCNAVTGPGMRFCHTCSSGLGPKSKNCPNCGKISGGRGELCYSCLNGFGPPLKVRLDRCPRCGKMNGLPGSLCFSCARS